MNARLLTSLILSVALIAVACLPASAQNQYQRLSIIEEFTSATCGPCIAADAAMLEAMSFDRGVVSVRFHMHYPANGDPWNLFNASDASVRHTYYGVRGIPYGRVNGKEVVITNASAIINAVATDNAVGAPCKIDVEQVGTNVKVTVTTDIDLNNHILHVALVSRRTTLPTLPQELSGSNGATVFDDAMLRTIPTVDGTNLNIAAGTEREYDFTFSMGAGRLWPAGQQYINAYIQNKTTRDVIQAGTSLKEASLVLSFAKLLTKVQPNTTFTQKLLVRNNRSFPVTADLAIKNAAELNNLNWIVTMDVSRVTLQPNSEQTVDVNVTVGGTPGIGGIQVESIPLEGGVGIPIPTVGTAYVYVQGARVAWLYGTNSFTNQAPYAGTGYNIPKYANQQVVYPLSSLFLSEIPLSEFDALILPISYANRGTLSATVLIDAIEEALSSGKGAMLFGELEVYLSMNAQANPSLNPKVRSFFENTLAVQTTTDPTLRLTVSGGNITAVNTFPVAGVSNDPVTHGLTFTANQYVQGQWQAFQYYTNNFSKRPGSKSEINLTVDNDKKPAGLRYENANGGRFLYSAVMGEAMRDLAPRQQYFEKSLDWLLGERSTKAPKVTLSQTQLVFGDVPKDQTKTLSFNIGNESSATADLVISQIYVEGTDNAWFEISEGEPYNDPVTVKPGATHKVSVRFAPTQVRSSYTANVRIVSNAGERSVGLSAASTTGVETEATSETGALSLSLVGNNPINDRGAFAVNSLSGQPLSIRIVDAVGRTVESFNQTVSGFERIELNAGRMANGMYTIHATDGTENVVLTFVVQK